MSSTWVWFILVVVCLVLATIAFFVGDEFDVKGKRALKTTFFSLATLLAVLAVVSFVATVHNRHNHRATSLTAELRNKGFMHVNITDVYSPSKATVTVPGYPGGCRLSLYKQGNWLLDVAQVTRSVTTPKDMLTWSSVKFVCNKNAQ